MSLGENVTKAEKDVEIMRLKRELAVEHQAALVEAREADRLRKELAEVRERLSAYMLNKAAVGEQESARLRTVLEKIFCGGPCDNPQCGHTGSTDGCSYYLARAALSKEKA